MRFGRLLAFFAAFALVSAALAAQKRPAGKKPHASAQEIRQARHEFQAGQRAEKRGDWTLAFSYYSRAAHDWPERAEYRLRESLARFHLVQARAYQAESEAANGHLRAAQRNFKLALALEPSYSVARQRLGEIDQMLAKRPEIEPGTQESVPRIESAPGKRSFDYRGDTEGAYQEIARQFGVEAGFDPEMPHQTIRFQVNDVDFPTAMRLLGEMTGTFWRPLTPRLFFVTADTPAKVLEYAPSIVRTVLLPASQSVSDMEETARIVRSIAEITRTQLDTAARTLTLRGTPDKVNLATALIHEIEQPRGEILLELDILEVDRNLARQIGVIPPTSATVYTISPTQIQQAQSSFAGLISVITQIFGQPSAIAGLPASQVSALLGAGQLSISSLLPPLVAFGGGETTFLLTVPSAIAQLSESLNLVQSGQQMMLRAEDGEPATLFVGDRYPITLSTLSSSITAPAIIPTVSQSSFPRSDYPVGQLPAAIATADFNGDGYADMAVANETDNTVSILLNDGAGSFTDGEVIPVPAAPVALVTGDFNGDGKEDLAVVSRDAGVVSILSGNGDGTFSLAGQYSVGQNPSAIVTADFNGDGVADLAVANSGSNTVSILLGTGTGAFEAPIDLPTGTTPVALATADFNGDSKADLAIVDQGDNAVLIYMGNGDGTFTRGSAFATGDFPTSIVAADFNNDSKIDLAVTNQNDNTVSVLFGNGDGTFQSQIAFETAAGPVAILAADFNIDGVPDLAVANENDNTVSIFLNNGTGNFGNRIDVQSGTGPDALASADFDQNGRPDLAIANGTDNNVSVILNDISLVPGSNATQTPYPGSEFVDLGLKVTVTPRLHPDHSVTLKMKVEIKGLGSQDVNGIPVLTNRSFEQTARVVDGQPTMIVSALQPQESLTLTGWPGLQLLAHRNRQNQNTELVIVVRPHLVRMPNFKSKTIYAGVGPGTP
jgi:Bacterial type II and III secretion system protein/FG-GAP-like repeat